MAEFCTIPKSLPSRSDSGYAQKIPKIILQTMESNYVPRIIGNYANTWIEKNPEYEYRFSDNDERIHFIKSEFPEYLDGYLNLKYGSSKADLWRYLVIYKYGGVYADIDCKCINPLREWIDPAAEFVTHLGINKDICQWLIISVPGNPIFLRAAEKTLQNSKHDKNTVVYKGFKLSNGSLELRNEASAITIDDEVLALAGPPVLQAAAEECFADGSISGILRATQVVCVSGEKSCEMNGNVKHDCGNVEYLNALNLMKIPHYSHRLSLRRILRKLGISRRAR